MKKTQETIYIIQEEKETVFLGFNRELSSLDNYQSHIKDTLRYLNRNGKDTIKKPSISKCAIKIY